MNYSIELLEPSGICYSSGEPLLFRHIASTGNLREDYNYIRQVYHKLCAAGLQPNAYLIMDDDVYHLNSTDPVERVEAIRAFMKLEEALSKHSI